MLTIDVPVSESFDEAKSEFITNTYRLDLEHSLVSLSKWESHFEKPFLSDKDKTPEETMWYIQAMIITPDVPPEIVYKFSEKNIEAINVYINGKQTATWFSDQKRGAARQIITAEVIYGWMSALAIDLQWENRHLNRLFTLIRTVNEQNAPKKKMSRQDAINRQRSLNEQRQQQYGTTG